MTGAAISGIPGIAQAASQAAEKTTGGKSRVVIATNSGVLHANNQLRTNVLGDMLDASVAKLTAVSSGREGWKKLFSADDVVGIKVNCLFGKGVATRPEFADTVAQRLISAGVKPENIIIWDRSTADLIKCGFTPNKDGAGVKCYGDDGDWGKVIERGSFKGRITKIISDKVTAVVNLPILKTHGITGISCCLKNHYGSFDNPGSHHSNHCNPALADFNSIPVVRNKTRLVLVDALRPQYDGGPGLKVKAQSNYHSVLASVDPLAADYEGLQIIEKQRSEKELDPLPTEKLEWMKSAQSRGVGTCDPAKIEAIRV